MQTLNLPAYCPKVKGSKNNLSIFDFVRKKYVKLTPEEWVRQHILHFLTEIKGYPLSLISVEKQLIINGLKRRFDVLIFDKKGQPHIIIECKAPSVTITQETFDQVARYNMVVKSTYMMVSNGLEHYFCEVDAENQRYVFLEELPCYSVER